MVQVFLIDEDGFYTGEDAWVEEPKENEITDPYSVGYIRGKWDGEKWVEGATEEEIREWEEQDKIDICPPKTLGERVEELEQESKLLKQENELLKQENQLLHTQVEATTQNQEFLESCLMEIAEVVYA